VILSENIQKMQDKMMFVFSCEIEIGEPKNKLNRTEYYIFLANIYSYDRNYILYERNYICYEC